LTKKIKVLTLSDHPLAPSGVGTQTKYMCEALLNTGKFSIVSFGGAIKHESYEPTLVSPYGEDWKIVPIDGFGSHEIIRSVLRTEKPDILWFMTDPRFFGWLWEIENEIRSLIPMVYYHVWDNFPTPMFNRDFYLSTDKMITISKVTDKIVAEAAPEVDRTYLPHAVPSDVFRPLAAEQKKQIRQSSLSKQSQDKVVFFWNNRNARRKQSGTLIYWFKEFLDEFELHEKAMLIMHTDPKDPNGQDLLHLIDNLKLNTNEQVLLSVNKISPDQLAAMYNLADCTINISDAEGFGLSTLESLSCGTPIIVNMTGGLQEQINTSQGFAGFPLYPTSKAIIGSQNVPYIYEDRLSKKQVISALHKMYLSGPEERGRLGEIGRKHVMENYNFEKLKKRWVQIMLDIHEKNGSWETRNGYSCIRFLEVA